MSDSTGFGVESYTLDESHVREIVEKYESQFGISSEEFLRLWEKGEFEDTFEANDWSILLSTLR